MNLLDLTEEELKALHTPIEIPDAKPLSANEVLDNHLFQLNALSVPYNFDYVSAARNLPVPYDLETRLSTGEPKNLGGYLLQMINVFGEDSKAANKARKQIEIYGADYVPTEDENSYSYFLGLAFVEESVENPIYIEVEK